MLKIGTRGSLLATTQAGHVRDALIAHGYPSQLEIVTTAGDVNMAPVERIGVGVFTQALREALADGVCDIAVHSFKDLPTTPDDRFQLIVPRREDPRDCLIARDGLKFAELPAGAVIGTGAPRRIAQLKALRPDIVTVPLRGNIDSRMAKVTNGELDAVVLAYAVDIGATTICFPCRIQKYFPLFGFNNSHQLLFIAVLSASHTFSLRNFSLLYNLSHIPSYPKLYVFLLTFDINFPSGQLCRKPCILTLFPNSQR